MKGAATRRRIRIRRERRAAARAARRSTIADRAARTATHVVIDEHGNVSTVEVDRDRFEAALARFDVHPHDDADDDDADDAVVDVPLFADEADCPLCKAIELSRIGDPVPFGLGRGAC